jgi:hypothetical protein
MVNIPITIDNIPQVVAEAGDRYVLSQNGFSKSILNLETLGEKIVPVHSLASFPTATLNVIPLDDRILYFYKKELSLVDRFEIPLNGAVGLQSLNKETNNHTYTGLVRLFSGVGTDQGARMHSILITDHSYFGVNASAAILFDLLGGGSGIGFSAANLDTSNFSNFDALGTLEQFVAMQIFRSTLTNFLTGLKLKNVINSNIDGSFFGGQRGGSDAILTISGFNTQNLNIRGTGFLPFGAESAFDISPDINPTAELVNFSKKHSLYLILLLRIITLLQSFRL